MNRAKTLDPNTSGGIQIPNFPTSWVHGKGQSGSEFSEFFILFCFVFLKNDKFSESNGSLLVLMNFQ